MPRKAFVADLQEATKKFERINVSHLKAGEEDGMINFHYHISDEDATEITVMVPGKCSSKMLYLTVVATAVPTRSVPHGGLLDGIR